MGNHGDHDVPKDLPGSLPGRDHASQVPGRREVRATEIPRLVPEVPLPSYAYVPGRTARPAELSHPEPIVVSDWRICRTYLLGIDLYNHGYYWEAHECWEAVWIAAGRRGCTADFLKGLIKLTAAFVKARQGSPVGVARHARRAQELFQIVAAKRPEARFVMGLALSELEEEANRVAHAPDQVVNARDVPVARVTDFIMRIDPKSSGSPSPLAT